MTREEAKAFLTDISYDLGTLRMEYLSCNDGEKMRDAIKALEQEPILDKPHIKGDYYDGFKNGVRTAEWRYDKIRAEIKHHSEHFINDDGDDCLAIYEDDVLAIIDKYKAASEGKKMTNGEKIKELFPNLKCKEGGNSITLNFDKHIGTVIPHDFWYAEYKEPTTKNDLGVDCVDRRELLKIYEGRFLELQKLKHLKDNKGAEDRQLGLNYCINILKEMPSVIPQEPRWIPVSERLPEEWKSVLVCYKSQGGIAQCVSERLVNMDGSSRWSALCGQEPIAWMPLPEPYKADRSEENEDSN